MKRLLAYLFIVLGLGLINPNSAFAPLTIITETGEARKEVYSKNLITPNSSNYFALVKPRYGGDGYTLDLRIMLSSQLINDDRINRKYKFNKDKFFIFTVDGKEFVRISKGLNKKILEGSWFQRVATFENNKHNILSELIDEYVEDTGNYKSRRALKTFFNSSQETVIAKVEPSQTQEVAEKEVTWEVISKITGGIFPESYDFPFFILKESFVLKQGTKDQYKFLKTVYDKSLKRCKVDLDGWDGWGDAKCVIGAIKYIEPSNPSAKQIINNKDGIELKNIKVSWNGIDNKDTLIAKEEPTIKPKKKKKVKVAKTTQEEFKPEDKDIDNDAPVIQIAEAITVNDSDYEFEGKVTDKSKQIFVEVDGRLVDVKKGKFTVKGYSPVDKEISIQAIDGYGNRSKPKIVKLIIDIKDTDIAEKLEPLNPSKIRAKVSKNKVALIIGIENYTESPNAQFANLDAKYFFDYARKAFGVKKQNIKMLIDEEATFVKTNKAITKWLKGKIINDKSELIIFFAGHGLASSDGKELFLLSQDSDPDMLSITALSRTKLFETIIGLNPKSVTMFLDTCYSGVSRDEQMLLASARPIRIVADEQEGIPDNFTIFSASQLDQISSGLKDANHGIFSYYLMKGLEGKADQNKDNKITNGELLAYMDLNVSQKASVLGREQNPSLNGDPDQVLMSYR